jgi:hypothetical protein
MYVFLASRHIHGSKTSQKIIRSAHNNGCKLLILCYLTVNVLVSTEENRLQGDLGHFFIETTPAVPSWRCYRVRWMSLLCRWGLQELVECLNAALDTLLILWDQIMPEIRNHIRFAFHLSKWLRAWAYFFVVIVWLPRTRLCELRYPSNLKRGATWLPACSYLRHKEGSGTDVVAKRTNRSGFKKARALYAL